jgi:hypothetical protein
MASSTAACDPFALTPPDWEANAARLSPAEPKISLLSLRRQVM